MALSNPLELNTTIDTANSNNVVSASVSPTGGALVVVCLSTLTANLSSSISAGFSIVGTWTKQAEATVNDGTGDTTVAIWTAVADATPGSGTVTATLAGNSRDKIIHVLEITGQDGTTPVAQANTNTGGAGSGSTLDVTLSSAPAATSVVIGTICIRRSTSTDAAPVTGYTEIVEADSGTTGAAIASQAQYDHTSPVNPCGWTNLAENAKAGAAIEISEAGASYTLDQDGFRWREDDGSESGASWRETEDTGTSADKSERVRLRVQLDASGDPDSSAFQLEFNQETLSLQEDDFTDNSQDIALWDKEAYHDTNASVTVVESGGQLTITPLTSTAGENYNGYLSTEYFDFTDGELILEVPTVTGGNAVSELLIVFDTEITAAGFDAEGGQLYFVTVVEGTFESTNIAYNGTDHRWWRFRHVSSDDTFRWETSTDGASWTQRRSRARNFDITAIKFQILAGSYSSEASPGTMVSDNFYAGTQESGWTAVASSGTKIILSASANIAASGENTTAQLTAPSGKTTGDFSAGRIQDDENPADSVDILTDEYTEMEWSIEANTTAIVDYNYEFRVTVGGVALDTYSVTPVLTITESVVDVEGPLIGGKLVGGGILIRGRLV